MPEAKSVKISDELHRALHAASALRGLTMRDAVEQAIGLLLLHWENEDAKKAQYEAQAGAPGRREWGTE